MTTRDRARGEVYVVREGRLRVVLLYEEEWSFFTTKLSARFGKAFVKAYKKANGLR
jgi:hypothetical protein